MEEILKNIESEINFIKEQHNELEVLTNNSKEVQDELKKLQQEQNSILDKDSGFFKDMQEEIIKKDKEFRQEDIKRMEKDREIKKLISEKKKSIIEQLEEKKKYIDENRNVDLKFKIEEAKKLQKEKEDLEAVVNRDIENGVSDNDQIQQFRRKKINDLNTKIEEIEELKNMLNGKEPKEKFMEIENLIKIVEDKFNRDGFDEILENIGDKTEKESEQQNQKNGDYDEFFKYTKETTEYEQKDDIEQKEVKNVPIYKEKPATAYNSDYKIFEHRKEEKDKIILDVSKNKINVNGNTDSFYKEEFNNKNSIIENYGINGIFYNDKKEKNNIDYALISTLEKIDKSLVGTYLKVIKNGNTQSEEIKESIEKLNKVVDIEYKFNKQDGILTNWKEKRIARNAKKLGIASLDGISEKSILDIIKEKISKVKDIKMLIGKEKRQRLSSGENTRAQNQKAKAIDLINQDREQTGIRKVVKVDNKDNRIELTAQEKQKDMQEQLSQEVSQENDGIGIE